VFLSGFGLRTSPIIHQIAKAAGILDLSAKVRGSRNGMNTVKATINLLHGGAPPLGLGDISGKEKLARRFKGTGMRTATEIGLDLGRKAVELR
jgi:small subunit ribosomal protein S5